MLANGDTLSSLGWMVSSILYSMYRNLLITGVPLHQVLKLDGAQFGNGAACRKQLKAAGLLD